MLGSEHVLDKILPKLVFLHLWSFPAITITLPVTSFIRKKRQLLSVRNNILDVWHVGMLVPIGVMRGHIKDICKGPNAAQSGRTKTSFVKLPYLIATTILVNILLEKGGRQASCVE